MELPYPNLFELVASRWTEDRTLNCACHVSSGTSEVMFNEISVAESRMVGGVSIWARASAYVHFAGAEAILAAFWPVTCMSHQYSIKDAEGASSAHWTLAHQATLSRKGEFSAKHSAFVWNSIIPIVSPSLEQSRVSMLKHRRHAVAQMGS